MLHATYSLFLFALTALFSSAAKAQIDAALFKAIKNCDFPAVQKAVGKIQNINATDSNNATALLWAVYYCDLPMVKYLVEKGATVKDSGVIYFEEDKLKSYGSASGLAAGKGKLKVLQYLVDSLHLSPDEKGYDPFSRKKDSWAPLLWAVHNGQTSVAAYLLQKGIPADGTDEEGNTPLTMAAEKERWDIFKLLLKSKGKEKLGNEFDYFMNEADTLAKQGKANGNKIKELAVKQFIVRLCKAWFGEEHISHAFGLNELALLFRDMGQYEKSLPLFEQAKAIYNKALGDMHPSYSTSLNNLATLYQRMGRYEKALPLFVQANAIDKKTLGEEHPDYASGLNNLALQYHDMGRYDKALPLYERANSISKKALGEEHPDYAQSLNNLAVLNKDMGQYEKALPLYERAAAISKKVLGEEHPDYASGLNNLALLYQNMGQYDRALPLYEQAMAIRKKALGEEHRDYATSLNNLAGLFQDVRQYDKALPLYEQALAIRKKALGEEHPSYATSLNNLAVLYQNMGQYDKALPLIEQAIAIRKKALGEEHPIYGQSLNNLASLYRDVRQYDKALPLIEQATAIVKKALGEEHPIYGQSVNNLASLYRAMGQNDKALLLCEQAIAIKKKALGEEHPEHTNGLYNRMGKYEKVLPLLTKASTLSFLHLTRTYTTLSEQEKLTLLDRKVHEFNTLPSFVFTKGINQSTVFQQVYDNELVLKGMVLEDQKSVLNSIRKSDDSTTLQLYDKWYAGKLFIGKQLLLPIKKRVPYLDSLQETTNRLEQQLSRRSASFSSLQQRQHLTTKDIFQKLPKGQAAVEFIRFPHYNRKLTDSIMYAALVVLPHENVVHFVPLFEEKQLQRLLQPPSDSSTAYETIEQLYGIDREGTGLNDSLYHLIWKPLEAYLTGIHTISYAPAGLLHRVAFPALHSGPTHFLIDKYRLRQLLSTRSVALSMPVIKKPSALAVWGDITYSFSKENSPAGHRSTRGKSEKTGNTTSSFNFYTWDSRDSRGGGFNPLPGTRQEMDSLKKIGSRLGISIITRSGRVATEEAFKALDGKSPQVLHLATHGFFLPVPENQLKDNEDISGSRRFMVQQNPMLRSGLVLTGGNHTWKGDSALAGREDGILTAYEIAQMDLSSTDLVVLSACNTALGDLQGNEGAIGLQRAFKLAGVRQIVMSLWPVSDRATAEFMTLFYRGWLGGQTPRDALRSAQLKMKEKYKDPFFWAAFVIVE